MGLNIFTLCEVPYLKKLLLNVLDADKLSILNIYKTCRPIIPKGFTIKSLNKIPVNLLLEDIIQKALYPPLYKKIMEIWFYSNPDLYSVVSAALINSGYKIKKLPFDRNGIYCQRLNNSDIIMINTKSYFAPKGRFIEGYDRLDVTVMAHLLGWCIFDDIFIPELTKSDIEKFEEDVSVEEIEEQESNLEMTDEKDANIEEIEEEKSDLVEIEEKDNNIEEVNDQNSDFEKIEEKNSNIELVNDQDFDLGKIEEKSFLEITNIYEKMVLRIFEIKSNYLTELKKFVINFENEDFHKINRDFFKIDSLNCIVENYLKTLKIQNIVSTRFTDIITEANTILYNKLEPQIIHSEKLIPDTILDKIKNYKEEMKSIFSKLIIDIDSLIADLSENEKDEVNNMITPIVNNISDEEFYYNSSSIIDSYKSLQEVRSYAADMREDFKLFRSCINYSNNNSISSLQIIYDHFKKSGNFLDCFTLLFAISQDETSKENYISILKKNQENIINILLNLIKYYNINVIPELVTYQLFPYDNFDKKGNYFYFLINIAAFLFTQNDIAEANLWNVTDDLELFPALKSINNKILQKDFTGFHRNKYDYIECEKNIESFFEKDKGIYKNAKSTDWDVRDFLITEIELLRNLYLEKKKVNNINEIIKIIEYVKSNDIHRDILNESVRKNENKKHNKEYLNRAEGKKLVNSFINLYLPFLDASVEKINNRNKLSISDLELDLNKIQNEYPDFKNIIELILQICENSYINNYLKTDLFNIILENALKSEFLSLNFPAFCSKISNIDIDFNLLLKELINTVAETEAPDKSVKILLKENNLSNSKILIDKFMLNEVTYKSKLDNILIKIEDCKNELIKYNLELPLKFNEAMNISRFGFALNVLNESINDACKLKRKNEDELYKQLDKYLLEASELKTNIINSRSKYRPDDAELLFKAIAKVEVYCFSKRIDKVEHIGKILEEVSYLLINNDSFLKLKELAGGEEVRDIDIINENNYQNLSLQDVLIKIEEEDHIGLGIKYKDWKDITDTRKILIKSLIRNFIYLQRRPVIREEVNRMNNHELIHESLINISKSLGEICSLYITNDNNRITVEPFESYDYDSSIPFVFRTKIINPKCEPLNQIINIYFITDIMLENNSYINKIRHYFKKDPSESYKMLFLIGDRNLLNKRISHTELNDIPILDEQELKSIFFSTESGKNAKWKFTYLLIQSENISDIQPFKSESLVRSDNNIFVGRDTIINKIIRNPINIAFYGGRRIGKSSLLTELNNKFNEKDGYKSIYCSLQGNNSLESANLILKHLDKIFGLNSNMSIKDLDSFKNLIMDYFFKFPDIKVVFFIDEIDTLIKEERMSGKKRHILIEKFRSITQETGNNYLFVFAGFKEMYKEIKRKDSVYDATDTPWSNFVEQTATQLIAIDTPEKLVNEGLRDILGLEYDDEVSKTIVNYSSGHPAFLQKFCQCLVINHLSNKINRNNRKISKEDIDFVFYNDKEFLDFVVNTIDGNLSEYQRLIVYIAAINNENIDFFDIDFFVKEISEWLKLLEIQNELNHNELLLELELLIITGVVVKSDNKYSFAHKYYKELLRRIIGDSNYKNIIENLVKIVFENKKI